MKTMTPSQIEKILENLRAVLRKHNSEFELSAVQTVLGNKQLSKKLLTVVRECVEAVNNLVTRRVEVDLFRSPQDSLKATGRNLYTDNEVVANMPKGKDGKVEVVFFKVGHYINDDQLEEEYKKRGLVPVDPYSLSAVNEDDPKFADKHPNGTHWQHSNGKWCFAAFDCWLDGRVVDVGRNSYDWNDYWWFGGLPQVSSQN